jgi:hypothetical protein
VTGELVGSKTLIKLAGDANPNLERRATLMFFTFAEPNDRVRRRGLFAERSGIRSGPIRCARDPGRNRQVHWRTWPGGKYAQCGWFLQPKFHIAEIIEERRVGAMAGLAVVQNEPYCLDFGLPFCGYILLILS